ncbi:hypothetical protein DFH05DRAFT_984445 [Lentinula detonsa]|uniref:AIG1-type G domain-containing protein n=1 Tax=Lentinula detonsa TaxID=2804962 RepID=A0A9W8P4M6_9AGAR|nr:hypothetical protein DFH05DRAFT_984445 [Lentinula detonsa]
MVLILNSSSGAYNESTMNDNRYYELTAHNALATSILRNGPDRELTCHLPSVLTTPTASAEASAVGDKPKKMTIELPWTKPVLNLILIGETGVGKTAFVNLLANVCAGTPLEEFEDKIKQDNEVNDLKAPGSQTIKPQFYSIVCANGQMVNVLDTPGLADDRGIDVDNEHKQAISYAIKQNFEVIDAVLILLYGGASRLTLRTGYTLNTISSMLPNSIIDNITCVFTSAVSLSFNLDLESLPQHFLDAPRWLIDNPFPQWVEYRRMLALPSTDEDLLDDLNESVHRGYKRGLKILSQLFQYLDNRKAQPAQSIFQLYDISMEIEAHISNAIVRISPIEDRRTRLKKLQADLQDQEHIMAVNEHYEKITMQRFYEMVDTGSIHNVLCTADNCHSNCLEHCNFPFTLDQETLAKSCSCFEDKPGVALLKRRCTVCDHLVEDHRQYRTRWVEDIRQERSIDEKSKKYFEAAKTQTEMTTLLMEVARKEIEDLERDIDDFMAEIKDSYEKYNKLSLSGNFIRHVSSAIRMLEYTEVTIKSQGADSETLDKIAKSIKRLEKKVQVLEVVEKRGKAKLQE